LDTSDNKKKVVIDMQECLFVDDTVMEKSLLGLRTNFDKHNGELQVIGLDLHDADMSSVAFRRALRFVPSWSVPKAR
jgi:hypothetical protein